MSDATQDQPTERKQPGIREAVQLLKKALSGAPGTYTVSCSETQNLPPTLKVLIAKDTPDALKREIPVIFNGYVVEIEQIEKNLLPSTQYHGIGA